MANLGDTTINGDLMVVNSMQGGLRKNMTSTNGQL